MKSGTKSASDAEKGSITFDTEIRLFEEMKASLANIQASIPDDSPYISIRNRFVDVYNYFVGIYQNNQILLQKAQEGNAQIIFNANKTSTILKIVERDGKQLEKYKKEYEETVSVLKQLNASEIKSRELLQTLSKTVAELNGQVQRGEAFCYGEEDTIGSILQDVSNLKRERDAAAEEINNNLAEIKRRKDSIKLMNDQIHIMKNNSKEIEVHVSEYQTQLDKLNAEIEIAREGIQTVRPIVQSQKSKIESNIQQLRENDGVHKELIKKNSEISKQLFDILSKSKQLKFQISQHTKQHNKLVRRNANLQDHCDHVCIQIDQSKNEQLQMKTELENINASIESNQEQLKIISLQFDEIEEKKRETRSKGKSLRDVLLKLKHNDVMQTNERQRTVRQMHSTTHQIGIVQTNLDRTKVEKTNVTAINVDLIQEKRGMKRKMQEEKIKLRQYEREIEKKEYEKMQLNGQIQLVDDDKNLNVKKIFDDNKYLDELTDKLAQQAELAEQLRKERNTFKRKFLACAKECEELSKLLGDLSVEVEELKDKNRIISVRAADEHYMVKCLKQRLIIHALDVDELRERVYHANHSITGLEAERQLMLHVINDAYSDKLLLQKELDTAGSSKKAVTGILVERRRTIDSLKSNIITLNQHVDRGKKEYISVLGKIDDLLNEMDVVMQKNEELERKRDRVKFNEHEERRLFNLVNQETQKNAALIREINLPRNVHRWQMYSATDPIYQRNLMYMTQIYAKLDVSHRYLIELEAKRDSMRKEVQEMKKKVIPNGEAEFAAYQSHIGKYKRDIENKERLIEEMKKEIQENRIELKNIENGVGTIRGKFNTRRISVSQLRSRKYAIKNEKRQHMLFLTEPEETRTLGGGFIQRIPTASPSKGTEITILDGTGPQITFGDNSGPITIDSSPRKKMTSTPRTPKGKGKRITRPVTAGIRRRPQTALAALA
ncbi:hypothetical protein TRFO_41128 [Tritrichomonas foetus]|uniref:Uncharacterized protein n=1 Tax=Tritrichomonas foetus TaxID=1144522 RepID=A0A1J4L1K1_9EUKA|nr:hypothetical protein [Tritrichomonas foetus]OHT17290.1 hypothetical protein TRFO_41128 [Tritrichomonas foetus]|eukprot:OHT17290.1 hypothetical protein TRFO_41128 [Tritrichomonas foetus]